MEAEADVQTDRAEFASAYARLLFDDLGATADTELLPMHARHPDLEWAASGAMALTGYPGGPPLLAPAPLASVARGAAGALAAVARAAGFTAHHRLREVDGATLLGERAALSGFSRQGQTSPGGSCHLLRSRDGWIAVNLARPDDVPLLPVWLGQGDTTDAVTFVRDRVRTRDSAALVAAARELGLPVAEAARPEARAVSWRDVILRTARVSRRDNRPPLVIDLSSLWAGPLAGHLLSLAGARVVKVESTRRADGSRRGPRAFFDLLNAGKESVALDFSSNEGRNTLRALLERADIVIEASRPRALAQLGIDAETIVSGHPGMVWVSITGYGRRQPERNWVAFGDDAGAAAGLSIAMCERAHAATPTTEGPLFCGDAIADPLTGIHAALAALSAWRDGGGMLLDINLRGVVAYALAIGSRFWHETAPATTLRARTAEEDSGWEVVTAAGTQSVLAPRARAASHRAADLGADTRAVLAELDIRC